MGITREELVQHLARAHGMHVIRECAVGHNGATVLLCERTGGQYIVKAATAECPPSAADDVVANIIGYDEIARCGVPEIVPPEYEHLAVGETPVLVMRYLGESVRYRMEQTPALDWYLRVYDYLCTLLTRTRASLSQDAQVNATDVVLEAIRRFQRQLPFLSERDHARVAHEHPRALRDTATGALMLLDFTPDNLFLEDARFWFTDPWAQATYHGYPGVSIGQFVIITRDVYQLPYAAQGAGLLQAFALNDIPELLGCSRASAHAAFLLGACLQFTLSAFVRREGDDQTRGAWFAGRALAAWDIAVTL